MTLLSNMAGRLVEDLVEVEGVVELVVEAAATQAEMCHSLIIRNIMVKVAHHSSVTRQKTHISNQVFVCHAILPTTSTVKVFLSDLSSMQMWTLKSKKEIWHFKAVPFLAQTFELRLYPLWYNIFKSIYPCCPSMCAIQLIRAPTPLPPTPGYQCTNLSIIVRQHNQGPSPLP